MLVGEDLVATGETKIDTEQAKTDRTGIMEGRAIHSRATKEEEERLLRRKEKARMKEASINDDDPSLLLKDSNSGETKVRTQQEKLHDRAARALNFSTSQELGNHRRLMKLPLQHKTSSAYINSYRSVPRFTKSIPSLHSKISSAGPSPPPSPINSWDEAIGDLDIEDSEDASRWDDSVSEEGGVAIAENNALETYGRTTNGERAWHEEEETDFDRTETTLPKQNSKMNIISQDIVSGHERSVSTISPDFPFPALKSSWGKGNPEVLTGIGAGQKQEDDWSSEPWAQHHIDIDLSDQPLETKKMRVVIEDQGLGVDKVQRDQPPLDPPFSLTGQEAIGQERKQDTLVDKNDTASKDEDVRYEWMHQPWAQYHIENDVEDPHKPLNILSKPWDLFTRNERLFGLKTDYDGATYSSSLDDNDEYQYNQSVENRTMEVSKNKGIGSSRKAKFATAMGLIFEEDEAKWYQ